MEHCTELENRLWPIDFRRATCSLYPTRILQVQGSLSIQPLRTWTKLMIWGGSSRVWIAITVTRHWALYWLRPVSTFSAGSQVHFQGVLDLDQFVIFPHRMSIGAAGIRVCLVWWPWDCISAFCRSFSSATMQTEAGVEISISSRCLQEVSLWKYSGRRPNGRTPEVWGQV